MNNARLHYEPFVGPIAVDNLDALFAHHAARMGGFVMLDDDDDDEGDGNDDTPGLDDDQSDDDDGEEYTPPSKEEWAKTQAALKKANAEAKKRRLAAKAKDDADDDAGGDEGKSARDAEKARADTEAKWRPRVIRQGAKAALTAAGAAKAERLFGLLDLDALDVDDDGEIDGLDDEIDRLKEEFPELFTRRRGSKLETGDRSGGAGPGKPLSATERQARAILGKSR